MLNCDFLFLRLIGRIFGGNLINFLNDEI